VVFVGLVSSVCGVWLVGCCGVFGVRWGGFCLWGVVVARVGLFGWGGAYGRGVVVGGRVGVAV